jgi:hypothetical protein
VTSTREQYSNVHLQALQEYLGGAGWSLLDQDDRTTLWAPARAGLRDADAAHVRLVLPLMEEVTDYQERVEQALRALSFVERRVTREILDDIVYGGADTVSVRLTPEAPAGEAPLVLAHAAIGALRNYVVGAASSLDIKTLVLPPRRPVRAEAYARDARLSTAGGSFVLNLALPLGEADEHPAVTSQDEPLLDLPPLPYGRRVTNRMIDVARRATALARSVGEGDEGIEAFARPDRSAANATELAALAAIGGEGGDERARYHLRFAHSPLAPTGGAETGDLIPVTPAEQRVLEDAADFLRTKQPRSGVTVSGLVVRLTRTGKLGPGDIVVQGIDDDSGAQRRFRMNLGEEDYSRAIRAHEYGLNVLAVGNVELRGNQRQLSQLTSFDVVEPLYDEA